MISVCAVGSPDSGRGLEALPSTFRSWACTKTHATSPSLPVGGIPPQCCWPGTVEHNHIPPTQRGLAQAPAEGLLAPPGSPPPCRPSRLQRQVPAWSSSSGLLSTACGDVNIVLYAGGVVHLVLRIGNSWSTQRNQKHMDSATALFIDGLSRRVIHGSVRQWNTSPQSVEILSALWSHESYGP